MAQIILGSYAVQFPLGGYLSWVLQWLVGFQRLGHDVYFVERSKYRNSCYDAARDLMSDDCSYGTAALDNLLTRFGLKDRWCFVDYAGHYHGLSRERIEATFRTADVFVDMGTHGGWQTESAKSQLRVLIDGEPASTQMKMMQRQSGGERLPEYDYYYTVGQNIGSPKSTAPDAGRAWRRLFYPVVTDLFPAKPPVSGAPFTTVMSWQAHQPVQWNGITYGQKDVEFVKFLDLPRHIAVPIEIAVAGTGIPIEQLRDMGWRLRDAHDVSLSFDSFWDYIRTSRGEFSVCKNIFVGTNSGWFGDRAAAYLSSGRPVVMQQTGFSEHLPCGRGLFAVRTAEEAAAAIDAIESDYEGHVRAAREIAVEYLDADKVLRRFLDEL